MLKKRLGAEAIERSWDIYWIDNYFKILPTLNIPESCVKIGRSAFDGCWWLEKVEIPEGVEAIEERAFCGCKGLKEVVIPKSVVRIRYRAFGGCYNATVILKKPESEFKYIGKDVFRDCEDVKRSSNPGKCRED